MALTVYVDIKITKIADEYFPLWLEFALTDRHGICHVFAEKAPVILPENEPIPEKFPKTIKLKCELIKTFKDYAVISTSGPYNIASAEGKTRFEISTKCIHDADNYNEAVRNE